ncbi:amidase [Bacillus mesophilus]|uniref:amidase n=1 Tax=Bacillus mesophilus TaxID=1808955 RepID=UPI0019579C2D|nr:amidase [Bacillus mesophilus]MBM7662165.1 amidase [Bacillus mesophilus]
MDSLQWLDATDLATLINKKEVSSEEIVQSTIERIERINPKVNAVNSKLYEAGLEASKSDRITGPFAGVPFLMKDLEFYEGTSYSAGSRYLKDFTAPVDSEYSSKIRNAGLITIGKTNTCEFGLLPTTEPTLHGPTRNPWSLEHTAGGSSGGAAAAVAFGMVPMAHASDGGGSIRIPASCCGLFGLKVSRGRNPKYPDTIGLSVNHCVSRSVRDSARLLDWTCGSGPGYPFDVPRPENSFESEVSKNPRKLRIAMMTSGFNGSSIHDDSKNAVLDAAALCESLGHEVELASPSIHVEQYNHAFSILWPTSLAQGISSLSKLIGRLPSEDELEPYTWEVVKRGNAITGVEYLSALAYLQQVTREMTQFFSNYDLLLTATLAEPPLKIGELSYQGNREQYVNRLNEWVPYTPLANTTGMPAMSVPLFWNNDGLPIGVHFMAPLGDEATLLQLAGQLEQARPWKNRIPIING